MYRFILLASLLAGAYGGVAFRPPALGKSAELPQVERIVGGIETGIDMIPYIVAILSQGRQSCGGSIIRPDKILSAAHCYKGVPISYITVRAGSTYKHSGGQLMRTNLIYYHELFNEMTIDADIAMIILTSPIIIGDKTEIIPMVSRGEFTPDGVVARISGWGLTIFGNDDSHPEALRSLLIITVNKDLCQSMYSDMILTENMICAGSIGEEDQNACRQDSGGPMVVNGKLVGIISWGEGCGKKYPGVFANVAALRNWIDQFL